VWGVQRLEKADFIQVGIVEQRSRCLQRAPAGGSNMAPLACSTNMNDAMVSDAFTALAAGEIDDAANVTAIAQVRHRLVDLVELVVAGNQLV
jgi:hypothetical protein